MKNSHKTHATDSIVYDVAKSASVNYVIQFYCYTNADNNVGTLRNVHQYFISSSWRCVWENVHDEDEQKAKTIANIEKRENKK